MKNRRTLLSILISSAIFSGEILAVECGSEIERTHNNNCVVEKDLDGTFMAGYSRKTKLKGMSNNNLMMQEVVSDKNFILYGGNTVAMHGDNVIGNNNVFISNGEIGELTSAGAYIHSGNSLYAKENNVFLDGVKIRGNADLTGTFTKGSANSTIENSVVSVKNSHLMNEVEIRGAYGGESSRDNAFLRNNLIDIDQSQFDKYALFLGGYAANISGASLIDNKINIKNSIFNGYARIYGAMNLASKGNNENNLVSIEKSIFNNLVDITGLISSITPTYTSVFVHLKDVIFNSSVNILGIKTSHSQDINGVNVTVDGHIEFNVPERSTILAGRNFGDRDRLTGNVFNFRADPLKLKSVSGFEVYKFFLNENVKDEDVLLNTIDTIDMNKSTVTVDGIHKGSKLVNGGGIVTLMSNIIGDVKLVNSETTLGTATLLTFGLEKQKKENGKESIIVNVIPLKPEPEPQPEPKPEPQPEPEPEPQPEPELEPQPEPEQKPESKLGLNPQTTAYLFGRNAGILVANDSLVTKVKLKGMNIEPFALIESGKNRFNIGKKLNLITANLLVGNAIYSDKINSSLGVFFEAGNASYTSYNQSRLPIIKGKGNVNYRGTGLLVQRKNFDDLIITGSLRVGKLNYDFKSHDFGVNQNIMSQYNSDSSYFGSHVGINKKFKASGKKSLTVHGDYQYTHINHDMVNIKTALGHEKIKFDAINSHQMKVGVLLHNKITENITLNTGVGYQYEFDGKSKGIIEGMKVSDLSSKGGSGFASIGVDFGEKSNFSGEFKFTGYIGEKQGINGLFNVRYRF
ncbi:autotransporter outer membrane beta-barrel domain-containing protein [Xenorhabdus griffiniae]|uniref:autotransporter outer membrane beta-barrel domain-containing protein n=1 Tax=Xenorhabdus griffiniae TaxID=351672 RepID=UPI00187EA3C1|nr:autotransporter outer membrane beta-barrel domain-containing protein [Xenorhabdus griffiniae]MBE8585874.1 autotransporter outer membrane beta-barrel domain-containing protein [Xenorhabdus griffiniae]